MDRPVPALSHLEGPVLDLVAEALHAPAARERALFRPEAVNAMLAASTPSCARPTSAR